TATVIIDNLEIDLPCEFKDDIITVRLSETYFKNRPDNFTIQLFSFGQPMRIKKRSNKNRTQYIDNEKLYNIKVKKDVHISKRYMSLEFKNENVEVNDVILQKDGIMIKLNRDVDEETSLFLSYPHKFIKHQKKIKKKKIKKKIHIYKRYMSLKIKNENVEVNDVILQKDGIMIKLNRDVDEETSLFLSYPHKFIELPTTLINKHTLKVTG